MSQKKKKGPAFIKYMKPIVESLKELGGSGNSGEVLDMVIEKLDINEEELGILTKTGIPRTKNRIHWAKMYLVKAGLIDSSQHGVWTLTEEGFKINIESHNEAFNIFTKARQKFDELKSTRKKDDNINSAEEEENDDYTSSYQDDLIKILQHLPPEGFERICQRLLRESGFKKVIVTGKSGDGGIDGEGILEINPLISFKVLFQSKRYLGTVSPSQVRDFRGAMTGRADKGIIITTGRFTQDAKKEAMRDGVPPIELVDGEGIVELFEKNKLGLKPKLTFEIDEDFFEEYK